MTNNHARGELVRAVVITALIFGLTTSSTDAFSSLYSYKDDGINILDSSNFSSFASKNPSALWIEFYNSWCGHCIRFAPIWKEFAKEVKEWKPVVQLAVIDCAEDRNHDVCREYEVFLYPSVRFFWVNNEAIRDFNLAKNSEEGTKNNSHLLGQQYEGDLDSTAPLMKGLVRTLLDHWPKAVPANFPQLLPIDAGSKHELVTKMHFRSGIPVIIVIDDSQSQLGPQLILDFSSYQNKVTIIWLSHIATDLKHQKLLKELLPGPHEANLPILLEMNPSNHEVKILCCTDNQAAQDKNIRKTFGQIIHQKYIPEPHIKSLSSTSTTTQKSPDREVIKSPSVIDTVSPVHIVDLNNALRYSLFNQITARKRLDSGQLSVFKDFIQVIDRFFPFGADDTKSIGFIKLLLKWSTSLSQYLESDELIAVMNKFEDDYSLPEMAPYKSCAGSDPKYRGYPCSLWTLFHTLTVNEYLKGTKTPGYYFSSDDSGSPHQVLQVMRSFITTFFGCSECAENFRKESANLDNELPHLNSSILWLWKTHNRVNKRLHGDSSEDPLHPKIPFPGRYSCPSCYISHNDPPSFNETQVFTFLVDHYKPLNIVRDSQISQIGRDTAGASYKNIEFDHDHKHVAGGDDIITGKRAIWSSYSSLMNKLDIGIFVVLYLFCSGLILYLFIHFRTKNKKKGKNFNMNQQHYP